MADREVLLAEDFPLSDDEVIGVLTLCANAARAGDADLLLAWTNGALSKRLLTMRGAGREGLFGGAKIPREF